MFPPYVPQNFYGLHVEVLKLHFMLVLWPAVLVMDLWLCNWLLLRGSEKLLQFFIGDLMPV